MSDTIINILQGGFLKPLPFALTGVGPRITAIADVILVAFLLTVLFRFLRRTRATNILIGFTLVGLGIVVARLFNLTTVNLILTVFFVVLLFALPFLFQPELRRGLERLGRRNPFWNKSHSDFDEEQVRAIEEALENLQGRRHGALIVLERQTGLTDYIDNGVQINADVVSQLIETIFHSGSSLHDGAMIIRENSIVAAACMLPLAEEASAGRLGTRHRAALGISEVSDAVAIVLSEERGIISMAADGKLYKVPSAHDLNRLLKKI